MKVEFSFKWYDLWIGFYWDNKNKELYFCPIPCCVFKFYDFLNSDEFYVFYLDDKILYLDTEKYNVGDVIYYGKQKLIVVSIKDRRIYLERIWI